MNVSAAMPGQINNIISILMAADDGRDWSAALLSWLVPVREQSRDSRWQIAFRAWETKEPARLVISPNRKKDESMREKRREGRRLPIPLSGVSSRRATHLSPSIRLALGLLTDRSETWWVDLKS